MNWTELFTLSASRVPYGVADDGRWGVFHRDGEWVDLRADVSPSQVTALQEAPAAFFARLRAALRAEGLDPALADTFPVQFAVLMGLKWDSDFWQAQALKWIEARGDASAYPGELRRLAVDGRSQAIRHQARRLALKMDRQAQQNQTSA